MLKGNVKPKRLAIASSEDLQLRGFLKCSSCGRMLTGSASKGRKTHVVYYHCKSPCKTRFNAKQLNEHFFEELKLFKVKREHQTELTQNIVTAYNEFRRNIVNEQKKHIEQRDKLDDKIIYARELLLDGSIEISDFTAIKANYAEKINILRAQLTLLAEQSEAKLNIQDITQNAIKMLCRIPDVYKTANVTTKRYIVETIFTGPLTYDGETYRTTTLNEVVAIIYLKNNELQDNKKRKKPLFERPLPSDG
jgi:site-specific DNA recombinase